MSSSGALCLFADRMPPYYGGMENHALHMIRYFYHNPKYPLKYIIKKDTQGLNTVMTPDLVTIAKGLDVPLLADFLIKKVTNSPLVCFFNSGRWIEELKSLKKKLPQAFFCQRTGGNDIMQASLTDLGIAHTQRQHFWVESINESVDAFITNSVYTTQRVISIGVSDKIIHQISGGVNIDICLDSLKKRKRLRKQFFRRWDSEICVVMASRFVEFKGIDTAISAVSLAQKKRPFAFFIVGGGGLESNLKHHAQKCTPFHCEFLGEKTADESLKCISASDLFLSTSREWERKVPGGTYIHTETMGRSVLEAVCSGIPVIATCVGGVPEFITSKYDKLVEPDSVEKISMQILDLLSLKKRIRENLDNIRKKYSWQSIFLNYINLWDNKNVN